MKRVSLVLAALVVQPGETPLQVMPPCQAHLELVQAAQLLTVTGHCRSLLYSLRSRVRGLPPPVVGRNQPWPFNDGRGQAPHPTSFFANHFVTSITAPARYRYQLLVVRQSPAGRSQSAQGGEFGLAPQQEVRLSEVRVSVLSRDQYRAVLLIFDQMGQIIARDSAVQVALSR